MDNPRFLLPIEPWAVLFQESVLFRYDFNKDSECTAEIHEMVDEQIALCFIAY